MAIVLFDDAAKPRSVRQARAKLRELGVTRELGDTIFTPTELYNAFRACKKFLTEKAPEDFKENLDIIDRHLQDFEVSNRRYAGKLGRIFRKTSRERAQIIFSAHASEAAILRKRRENDGLRRYSAKVIPEVLTFLPEARIARMRLKTKLGKMRRHLNRRTLAA